MPAQELMQAGATRYRLLETVRQYAQELLVDSEESEAVRARHRDFFLALAEEAEPQLSGAENGRWLERLETEHDNLRQALAFCLEEAGGVEASLRLGAALWRFWERRGHLGEGRAHMGVVLRRAVDPEQNLARAHVMQGAGQLAFKQGDLSVAQALHEESLAIYRELGDRRGVANSDNLLGLVVAFQGDFAAARALLEESLAIFRELGNRWAIAVSLYNLGNIAVAQDDYARARALYEESLAIDRELGNRLGIASSLAQLGSVASELGHYAAARALLEESLAISRELGDKQSSTSTLDTFAHLAYQEQQRLRAAHLWGVTSSLRAAMGLPRSAPAQERYEREVAQARVTLGEAIFDSAFEESLAMTWEQAVEYALKKEGSL